MIKNQLGKIEAIGALGSISNSYQRTLNSPEELELVLNDLFRVRKGPWHGYMLFSEVVGAQRNMLRIAVDDETGYSALEWSGPVTDAGRHSLNPEPFTDAPVLPSDLDDETFYWMRNAFVSAEDAEQAIREYVQTGQRPTVISWQEQCWAMDERGSWERTSRFLGIKCVPITDMVLDETTGKWRKKTEEELLLPPPVRELLPEVQNLDDIWTIK